MYPVSQAYKDAIMQPSRQFRGRLLIPKLTMNFTRNSIAYKQDGTQVAVNQPRFEQGQFGQAVLVEEGTTNAISYAFTSDTNLLQYFTDTHSGSSVTIDTAQTPPVSGQKVLKHYAAVNDSYIRAKDANGVDYITASTAKLAVTGGSYVTFSIWAKGQNGGEQIEIFIFDYASDTGSLRVRRNQTFTITNTWQRCVVTVQTASDAVRAWARVDNDLAGQTVYWCAPQLEVKPYATSFIDGTRADEKLTIPIEVLNHNAFTFEMWMKQSIVTTSAFMHGNGKRLLDLGQGLWLWNFSPAWPDPWGANRRIIADFGQDASGTRQFLDLISQTPFSTVNFEYFAITFDGATFRFYRNGVLWNSRTPSKINPFTQIVLGNAGWIIDDHRISSRAKTDEEILAAYREVA